MTIAIYSHKACLEHDPGSGHPENDGRLSSIMEALTHCSFAEKLKKVDAPLATDEQLLLAHSHSHIAHIKASAPSKGFSYLDGDTVMSPGSLNAALRAAGAACLAVDDSIAGKYSSAFCAIRPPGHHATHDRAMRFCLFNTIAIAALYAQKQYKIARIAIVDFDVHHGNGTEDIVEGKQGILYISTHQSPLFPGTGTMREAGNNIINLTLPAGTDGVRYRQLFTESVLPALEVFAPEMLLVSAGFDGHRDDPLAGFSLVEEDYKWIGKQLNQIAQTYCEGKIISILEGGYDHNALAESVKAYLSSFL